MITPENARLREERCTRKIKRRILRKQARKARAEHSVKRQFTKDREEWQNELQRHNEEVYADQEETKETQEG